MEIREFAAQVLESASLEAKLAAPLDALTDETPGIPDQTPSAPGRPADLQLGADRERARLPGIHQLDSDEEQRGLLLHFFANHELLATELMALVLIKFPDAPAAFRRGVLNTLAEEQRHTRWYIERMKECGVRFGDFPVSGYFWDAVAPMETPLDYVTRLSLTFEQANLDYSRHYARIFRSAGDVKTSKILEQIYRDEIGHVGYGLMWFRRWKRGGDSDWDAFRKQLVFPLSPSRAKANSAIFNAEGRLDAGFDEDFVNQLDIFHRSKGRTPNVFLFRPDEEAAMASGLEGKGYEPREEVKTLAEDLQILPAFLALKDDVVLVQTEPAQVHLRHLRDCGFELPEFEVLAADGSLAPESLAKNRKLNDLRPWGWGPQSDRLMAPLLGNLPESGRKAEDYWSEAVRSIYSKAWDIALLEQLAAEEAVAPEIVGRVCHSMDEVKSAAGNVATNGFENAYLKAPFGASGQKNQRISTAFADTDPILRWSERILEQQGILIVEPSLERIADFSVQFQMTRQGLRRHGIVHLENDRRGQFVTASCGPKRAQGIAPGLAQFLMEKAFPIFDDDGIVPRLLAKNLEAAGFTGPVGVDALVYRDRDGSLHLKPVVEINPRYTMGRLALELMQRVAPGHWVKFEIVPKSEVSTETTAPTLDAAGKLSGGSVILNDPIPARRILAVLHVARRSRDLVSPEHSSREPLASII